jgi:hypothetical protein
MGAAAGVSLALHALGVWLIVRARLSRERTLAPEEPMMIDVVGAEPAEPAKPAVVARSTERSVGRSVGAPLVKSSEGARRHLEPALPPRESPAPVEKAPAPPRGPVTLALKPNFVPLPQRALNFERPAGPPPMETPEADIDSVLEYKRNEERPTKVPEVWDKLMRGHDEPRPDYKIARHRDGSSTYDDNRANRFKATISPDGTIAFEDKHVHRRSLREQWRKWVEDPLHNLPPLPSLAFEFDLTDEIMRAMGEDPYVDVKRKLVAGTLDERQRMADEYRRETLQAAMAGLRSFLRALIADPTRTADTKRRLLHELADETDDTPAGRRAREIILEALDQFQRR